MERDYFTTTSTEDAKAVAWSMMLDECHGVSLSDRALWVSEKAKTFNDTGAVVQSCLINDANVIPVSTVTDPNLFGHLNALLGLKSNNVSEIQTIE